HRKKKFRGLLAGEDCEILDYLDGQPRALFMSEISSTSSSAKLIELTSELRALDRHLKSGEPPDAPLLREFRQALDNVRMTAWTTTALLAARHVRTDPDTVLSFLTAERLRRFSQMVKDLSGDLDADNVSVNIHGIRTLAESVRTLQDRLEKLAKKR